MLHKNMLINSFGQTKSFSCRGIKQLSSDKTSSDPIEFWYMPELSNEVQIGNPDFKQPQKVVNQTTNNHLKRPKQRAFDGEESF